MTHHFRKKRRKARENSENNMAERLAPSHLRLLSNEAGVRSDIFFCIL
jgi:hypothetical protein